MSWFAEEKKPELPKREQRKKCWQARDNFFACLDEQNIVNPLDPAKAADVKKYCGKQDVEFGKECIASWVKYFKEKRPFDIKKERMLAEAEQQGSEIVQMPGYRK